MTLQCQEIQFSGRCILIPGCGENIVIYAIKLISQDMAFLYEDMTVKYTRIGNKISKNGINMLE